MLCLSHIFYLKSLYLLFHFNKYSDIPTHTHNDIVKYTPFLSDEPPDDVLFVRVHYDVPHSELMVEICILICPKFKKVAKIQAMT